MIEGTMTGCMPGTWANKATPFFERLWPDMMCENDV
jgi:hypothetical protein